MNIYKVTGQEHSLESVKGCLSDRGNEFGYTRSETYYDVDGKIAFKMKKFLISFEVKVEAVSEEAVRHHFFQREIEFSNLTEIHDMNIKVELVQELDINPFEHLNPKYLKRIKGSNKTISKEFIEELDAFCNESAQKEYQAMSVEERKEHLEEFVMYDDQAHFAYGI